MNPRIDQLHRYPFERLRDLLADITPADLPPISLGVGEPRHPAPKVFLEALTGALEDFARYPSTAGSPFLREASAAWLTRRFQLPGIDAERQVIPCAGTREALFSIAQAVVGRKANPVVLMPNPFYQIYEGAALWAGATPYLVPATEASGFLPDYAAVPPEVLARTELLYVCSPGNPTGRVAPADYLERLIALADAYDFVLASDECYAEIYPDEAHPPLGLLQVAAALGRADYRRCLVFHSLSKRSNLPGARCGFVAGDADVIAAYLRLRTYTGCAVPPPIQQAAVAAWNDETHVRANRDAYRAKFRAVTGILGPHLPITQPDAGFYLWLTVPGGGEAFSRMLFERCNITALPGAYLSRTVDGVCPGRDFVRVALVDQLPRCIEAAERIRGVL
ncbi:MAG: succinyldiaminopimelate transaminase [Nitrospirae bacterium]|nr:succinyldiaminopimelate transaminase [Nitrospirota bacterium]